MFVGGHGGQERGRTANLEGIQSLLLPNRTNVPLGTTVESFVLYTYEDIG
jgi:hypothetical protein